jgi:UDP-N-acetylmuramoyl-L-alanyl-D-glutamate--2,6-diaminopimelate ligase
MKDRLVSKVRSVLSPQLTKLVEETYRRARVHAISAKYGYPAKGLRVLAVTGTNGKTTTANYLNEILKAGGKTTAMFTTAVIEMAGERHLNDLNATVASTERMQQFFKEAKEKNVDFVVLEITSHSLHQHKLDTVPIECAIMTNLTQDHLDYHKTMDDYAAAKGMLFARRPRYIVLNHDDEWFTFFDQFEPSEQKITYGQKDDAECQIVYTKQYKKGSDVRLQIDHQTQLELGTMLPGLFNVYNMTAAVAASYLLHIDLEAIEEGVANLEAIPGRFERIEINKPYDVVVDYAHTPDALEKLLTAARENTKSRVILVFGATGDRDKAKRPIMGELAGRLADRIYVTDEESYNEDPKVIRDMVLDGISQAHAESKTEEIADRREAIRKAMSVARKGDTILVTGMGHEVFRIVNGERLPWNDGDVVRELALEK